MEKLSQELQKENQKRFSEIQSSIADIYQQLGSVIGTVSPSGELTAETTELEKNAVLAKLKDEVASVHAQLSATEGKVAAAETKAATWEREAERLEAELTQLKMEVGTFTAKLMSTEHRLAEAESKATQWEEKAAGLELELAKFKLLEASLTTQLITTASKVAAAEAKSLQWEEEAAKLTAELVQLHHQHINYKPQFNIDGMPRPILAGTLELERGLESEYREDFHHAAHTYILELDHWIRCKGMNDEDQKIVLFYGLLELLRSYRIGSVSFLLNSFRPTSPNFELLFPEFKKKLLDTFEHYFSN